MFGRMIDAICERIRQAVYARLSEECDAADGCGELEVTAQKAIAAPSKKR